MGFKKDLGSSHLFYASPSIAIAVGLGTWISPFCSWNTQDLS